MRASAFHDRDRYRAVLCDLGGNGTHRQARPSGPSVTSHYNQRGVLAQRNFLDTPGRQTADQSGMGNRQCVTDRIVLSTQFSHKFG